ncbi:hypothetical protein Ddc_14420 [Ditylenchus destructor]|nr:hypothetical protein Ddc_14420 [Ditylenchus destructor]
MENGNLTRSKAIQLDSPPMDPNHQFPVNDSESQYQTENSIESLHIVDFPGKNLEDSEKVSNNFSTEFEFTTHDIDNDSKIFESNISMEEMAREVKAETKRPENVLLNGNRDHTPGDLAEQNLRPNSSQSNMSLHCCVSPVQIEEPAITPQSLEDVGDPMVPFDRRNSNAQPSKIEALKATILATGARFRPPFTPSNSLMSPPPTKLSQKKRSHLMVESVTYDSTMASAQKPAVIHSERKLYSSREESPLAREKESHLPKTRPYIKPFPCGPEIVRYFRLNYSLLRFTDSIVRRDYRVGALTLPKLNLAMGAFGHGALALSLMTEPIPSFPIPLFTRVPAPIA